MGQANVSPLESVECTNDEVRGWRKQKSKYLRVWRDIDIVFNLRSLAALVNPVFLPMLVPNLPLALDERRNEWLTRRHLPTATVTDASPSSTPSSAPVTPLLSLVAPPSHPSADSQVAPADARIASLSDDEDDEDAALEDKLTNLNDDQRRELETHGYCTHDPLDNAQVADTVRGFIRSAVARDLMLRDVVRIIVDFYHSRFNCEFFVEVVCADAAAEYLVVPRRNLALSQLLSTRAEAGCHHIELDKVDASNMRRVLRFLNHHRGRVPAPVAKPVRSVHMARNVEDPWDAEFIDECSKQVVFQLILAANYLDCPSLLHLGCAKIATLIKGKSPEEIRSILSAQE